MCALIVLAYIFLGGLTSAIYNEVLQFFLIVFGFLPLVLLGLQRRRRLGGLQAATGAGGHVPGLRAGRLDRFVALSGSAAANPMGVEWFGMVMGLGFVLSFGYWCTDFLVVQRAMAADSMSAARRTPLIAALPEDAVSVSGDPAGHDRDRADLTGRVQAASMLPSKPDGTLNYDMVIPVMLGHYFPNGMLGIWV